MSIAQQDFSYMSDPALQQAIMFAQKNNDTPTFLALTSEANKRKQARTAAQGQQAGAQQQQGTVADQVMSGIANLTSGNHEYANGGIVAFAGGGTPEDGVVRNPFAFLNPGDMLDAVARWRASGKPLAQYMGLNVNKPISYGAENTRGPIGMAPDDSPASADVTSAVSAAMQRTGGDMAARAQALTALGKQFGVDAVDAAVKDVASWQPKARGSAPAQAAPYQPQAQPQPDSIGGGTQPVQPAPSTTTIDVEKTATPEELRAKVEALSAKDNEGISAVYKRMADRDVARQAKLAGETEDKAGILGFKMSPAVREALLNAGIGAMTSKSTSALGGIGEGLAAGASAYKAGEKRRADRQDLLDEASDKRAMAEIAAKQGNQDRAAKLFGEAEALKRHAETIGMEKAKLLQHERLAREQMANARKVAGMGSRNQQLELYTVLGGGDPKKGYEFAAQAKSDPRSRDALIKQWSDNPYLQQQYPKMEDYFRMVDAASGSGAASSGWGQAKVIPN